MAGRRISPDVIETIDSQNFGGFNIENIKDARVLIINNCNTIQDFCTVCIMSVEWIGVRDFLRYSTHCFTIIANIASESSIEFNNIKSVFGAADLSARPFIIQLNYETRTNPTLIYKYANSVDLQIYDPMLQAYNDFDLLLRTLNHGLAINMLTCDIDAKKIHNGFRLIDGAITSGDVLAVRFLKLFFDVDYHALQLAAKLPNSQILSALLDLPIIDDGNETRITKSMTDTLHSSSTNGKSLICAATEIGETETVEFFIRSKFFNQSFEETLEASSCAFKAKKNENLFVLLKNDFPFPTNFYATFAFTLITNETIEKLKQLYDERKEFHENIKAGKTKLVEEFIEKNPNIIIGYSPSNERALTSALRAKKYSVYALLLCHRFTPLDDPEHPILCNELKNNLTAVAEVKVESEKYYGRPVDSHILFVFSKTRLGRVYGKKKEEDYFKKIKDFLDKLNQIDEVKLILKIVEAYPFLLIVFDFDSDLVNQIDITSFENAKGMFYLNTGKIYIAARSLDRVVLGTLIHELSHHAMQIMFGNEAKPFYANDAVNKKLFEEIVVEYKSLRTGEEIVELVFTAGYKEEHYTAELIVRVPEMIAFYHDDPMEAGTCLAKFPRLVKFYRKEVYQKIQDFIKDPSKFQAFQFVQQLNNQFSNVRTISDIKLKPFSDSLLDETLKQSNQVQVIVSKTPKLAIASMNDKFRTNKSLGEESKLLISMNLKNLKNYMILESVCSISNQIILIINCKSELTIPDNVCEKLFDKNSLPKKLFFVCDQTSMTQVIRNKLANHQILETKSEFKWDDLSEEMQSDLLQQKVMFQVHEISLNQIMKPNSESIKHLPLTQLVNEKVDQIGKAVRISKGYDLKYFIERMFHNQKLSIKDETFETFLKHSESQKMMLISDEAGMGKSTVLTHIALRLKEKFPCHWIVRIDLHLHVETIKKDNKDVASFIADLLKIESNFELQLLRELLNDGKVILLLDGLDEITPTYQTGYLDKFKRFVNQIRSSTVKQVWITLRPHLKDDLETETETSAWELKPFSDKDQIKFMTRYWRSRLKPKELTDNIEQRLKNSAKELIKNISNCIEKGSFELFGIPLQTQMIADIFFNDVRKSLKTNEMSFDMPEHFDLLWMCEEFILAKISIVNADRGREMTKWKSQIDLKSVNFMEFHENLALKIKFPDTERSQTFKPNVETLKEFQNFGIITVEDHDGKPHFNHQTYLEYFVTKFIFEAMDMPSKRHLLSNSLESLLASSKSRVILMLIDNLIERSEDLQQNREVQKYIASLIKKETSDEHINKYLEFLSEIMFKNNIFIVNFFLDCISFCSEDFISKLLKGNSNFTLLSIASLKRNISWVDQIWEMANRVMSLEERKKLYFQKISMFRGKSALAIPFGTRFFEFQQGCSSNGKKSKSTSITYEFYVENSTLTKMYNIGESLLNKPTRREIVEDEFGDCHHEINAYTMFHKDYYDKKIEVSPSAKMYCKYVLDHRWQIFKKLSKHENDFEVMSEKNLFTNFLESFMTISSYDDFPVQIPIRILEIYTWIHTKFHSKEILRYFLLRNFDRSMSFLTKEIAAEVLKIIKLYFNDDEFNAFLQNDLALLESSCFQLDFHISRLVIVGSKLFSKQEYMCMVLNKNNNRKHNMLMRLITPIKYLTDNSKAETLQKTLNILMETFESDEMFTIFKATTHNGFPVIDAAVQFSSAEKFEILLNCLDKKGITLENQRELMTTNALKLCISKRNKTLQLLLQYLQKFHNKQEIFDSLNNGDAFVAPKGREIKSFEDLEELAKDFC